MASFFGGEDMYYDSVDCLSSSSEDSASVMEGSGCEYEIWMTEPESVEHRRGCFLRKMGLGEFRFANKDEALGRMTDLSGAISLSGSWKTDEVDGSPVSVGRETEDETTSHVDDLDSPVSAASEVMLSLSVEGTCNEAGCVKATAKAKRISRWWSQLCKKPVGKGATEPDPQTPNMSQMKVHRNKKKCMEFSAVYAGQEIKAHKGFILTMKFSPDGQYLASGGQDGVVRIWRVTSKESCSKYSAPVCDERSKTKFSSVAVPDKVFAIDELPFQELYGHSGDILDLAWSNANLLLSSSKDKTVRLWEVGSDDCLKVFHHNDYVTCIQFNPVDDKHFITGSIDGKVRIWGVLNGRVVDWVYAKDVVTAVCYKPDGRGFVVGSVSGVCRFYGNDASKEHIQLEAQLDVQGRKKTSHNKITGIEFCQKEDQRVMITSEDSKVRIFEGINMIQKYKGFRNSGSQMSASFTSTGRHIISVGEDSRVYVWNYDDNHPPASKQRKSIHSCEHFSSEGVSVALPWSGRPTDHRNEFLPPHQQRGAEGFSLGSWFSMDNQCCSGRAATWPEEQLPLYESPVNGQQQDYRCFANEESKCTVRSEAWNTVIVTGGLDGSIRTFHNFGLPIRQ
uniref:Uncharacterized protein n=1 Tax=Kalanchoe fedtschenkoi TaxID=63787 RepID=A0A7N0TST8_KALFE